MLIEAARSALLVVDVQARVAPAMHQLDACLDRCRVLLETARRLELPILALEENPEGLGPTVPELAALLPEGRLYAKRHFNATAEPEIRAALQALGRMQIVLCGMEALVCVLQTALGLQGLGLPFQITDILPYAVTLAVLFIAQAANRRRARALAT